VEFVQENYRENQDSYPPLIYHSIQVHTLAGPKLLVLTGGNSHYRKWLRQYIAEGKAFVAKIPEDQNNFFISSSIFEIDVTHLHPLNLSLYRKGEEKNNAERDQLESKKYLYRTKKKTDKKDHEEEKKLQLKKENLLKAWAEKESAERDRLQQALEQEKKEQERLLVAFAEQRAIEEQAQKDQLEQKWLELKKRLLEDERIQGMELGDRKKEMDRRWLELKQRFEME